MSEYCEVYWEKLWEQLQSWGPKSTKEKDSLIVKEELYTLPGTLGKVRAPKARSSHQAPTYKNANLSECTKYELVVSA